MTERTFDVAIAGGGPAGASLAIRLAKAGASVLLVEQKRFPRHKLCGEFISPECLDHLRYLGVLDSLIESGASSLDSTIFYSRNGRSFEVPSEWLGGAGTALGISRSTMDSVLLNSARHHGATVIEEASVSGTLNRNDRTCGITLKAPHSYDIRSALTVDATGRSRTLARQFEKERSIARVRARQVAFKAHMSGASGASNSCEIYSYNGGYGGLNSVEGGLANLCFIVASSHVRKLGNDPDLLLRTIVMQNKRAAKTLAGASAVTQWSSVALDHYGESDPLPYPGLMLIGDAAAFIDPFTGSGMLIALESSMLAAETIVCWLNSDRSEKADRRLEMEYRRGYSERFGARLKWSSSIRRMASTPFLSNGIISSLAMSASLVRYLARATRQGRVGSAT